MEKHIQEWWECLSKKGQYKMMNKYPHNEKLLSLSLNEINQYKIHIYNMEHSCKHCGFIKKVPTGLCPKCCKFNSNNLTNMEHKEETVSDLESILIKQYDNVGGFDNPYSAYLKGGNFGATCQKERDDVVLRELLNHFEKCLSNNCINISPYYEFLQKANKHLNP